MRVPRRAPTIRRRLLVIFLLPLTLVLAVGIVVDYVSSVVPVTTAYDQALADAATAVAAHVTTDSSGAVVADLPPQAVAILRTDRFDEIYYLVLGPHGEFVSGDRGLPLAQPGADNPSYQDASFRGHAVRVASYRTSTAADAISVSVGETTHKRELATRAILSGTVQTDLLQLAATLLLGWFGVRYGLRPLAWLRDQITARSARDLVPLDQTEVPEEVLPLTGALNSLFARFRDSALAQQQFLANAAHQLRTPLAGVQAKIELLTHSPAAAPLRSDLMDLAVGCQRLAHTANQLLALARAEPSAVVADDFRPVDLQLLIEEVVEQYLDRAQAKNIDLGAETVPTVVRGSAWLLRELILNLVDNAITYTQSQGNVTARCGATDAHTFLEVQDDGPGIPADERTRVLERFYRAQGADGNGCGLGLAIVDEIVQVHAGTLAIHAVTDNRGTCVRVVFPARQA
ncbi:MAG: sensor histidine kinase [Rudaea sp.]|nr:sensor histidine kinase [Rudaea sp.]